MITFATVFTLTVTGPVTLITGVILLAVSRGEVLSSIVFQVLPQARTEFDLERFRKQWSGRNQMTFDAWIKQFSGETRPTSQFR